MSATPSEIPPLLAEAAGRGARYLAGIDSRPVAPTREAIARLSALEGPLPDGPSDPQDVLALLDEIGSPATVATAGGRFFGFVVGGSQPATVAANVLAAAWDQNAGMVALSPISAALEKAALRWSLDVMELPADWGGGFVSGATMANLSGLAAARHHLSTQRDWDVEARGLYGAPEIPVVVGEEVHVSVLKALGMLGLGRERVIRVPTDDQGRMRPDAMPDLDEPAIVCIQAGNVNTGAFDPATEICARAARSGSWVHVDGAFGLWARCAPSTKALAEGFDRADSWAVDAHKWLNVPYDSALVLCRHAAALQGAFTFDAAYLMTADERVPSQFTPEMSRRARGVEIWAALRALGRQGVAELVERTCRHAQRFAEGLSEAGHEILNDVVLNQVLVSFGSPEATDGVIRRIQEDGTCWCGPTSWQGRRAMRISVSSWSTTDEDVEASLAAILGAAEKGDRPSA